MSTRAYQTSPEHTSAKVDLVPILAISIAVFVTTFDITAVIMIMPRIKESMNLSIGGFALIMDSYSLSFTVFLVTVGVLADRYGRRLTILVGNVVFLCASLMCGLVESQTALLVGRVIQGIGAASIVCGGLALIGHRYVESGQRARAFGLLGTVSGLAMALGPLGGGLIADTMGWRWIFLLNVPICLATSIAILQSVDESRDPARRSVDVAGIAALSAFLISTVWILLHGASFAGLDFGPILGTAWILATAAAFIVTQRRAREPVLDIGLFGKKSFVGTCIVPVALSLGYWAVLVYLPLFLEDRLQISAKGVSIFMLAATLPMFVLPMISARAYLATVPSLFFSAALAVVALGCGILALAAQLLNVPLAALGMLMAGSGTAMSHSQVSGAIVALVPREQAGAASAVTVVLRQGSFAIGIALMGGVLRTATTDPALSATGIDPYVLLFILAGVCAAFAAFWVPVLIGRSGASADKSRNARDHRSASRRDS